MKNFMRKPIIDLKGDKYLMWVIIVAPLLNFLAGISIDLYAPSLPSIATYFNTSVHSAKNTITFTMLGFAFGCIIFGTLMDILGRRIVITLGLFIFILSSLYALFCTTITELMIVRFVQGMMVSSVSIGSRTLIIDNFSGKRFAIAILYTSVAYGSGPVIAPFIGGILQHFFNWKANFIAYAVFGLVLFALFSLLIKETLNKTHNFSFSHMSLRYLEVLKNKHFVLGVLILGGALTQQMIFPTLGPFVIETLLHKSSMTYGYCALLVGGCYLSGTLTSRLLISKLALKNIISIGYGFLFIGLLIQLAFAFLFMMNLFTLIFPIGVICFGLGFIFSNTLGACLKIFSHNAGVASAVQAGLLMITGSLGVYIISHFNVTTILNFLYCYGVVALFQLVIFLYLSKSDVFDIK